MPDDIKELPLMDQVALQAADPEMFALLSNTASADIELAASTNAMAAAAPTAQERQDVAIQERIAELTKANPYGKAGYFEGDQLIAPTPGNMTAALELEALSPELAAKLKAEARPAAPQEGLSVEAANRVNAEAFRLRMESMDRANQALQPQF